MATIHDLPDDARPREKLLTQGADSLSDAELLAIFLRTGIKGMNAIELAQHLLNHCDGVDNLLRASQSQFCQLKGLGPAKYAQLQAVLTLAKRYHIAQLKNNPVVHNTDSAVSLLSEYLAGEKTEMIAALWLNTKHHLIEFDILAEGSLREAPIYPREIVKRALARNAAAFILAHNHPSGDPTPSRADIDITFQLARACKPLDIRLLDHIIIGKGLSYQSLVEESLYSIDRVDA